MPSTFLWAIVTRKWLQHLTFSLLFSLCMVNIYRIYFKGRMMLIFRSIKSQKIINIKWVIQSQCLNDLLMTLLYLFDDIFSCDSQVITYKTYLIMILIFGTLKHFSINFFNNNNWFGDFLLAFLWEKYFLKSFGIPNSPKSHFYDKVALQLMLHSCPYI